MNYLSSHEGADKVVEGIVRAAGNAIAVGVDVSSRLCRCTQALRRRSEWFEHSAYSQLCGVV